MDLPLERGEQAELFVPAGGGAKDIQINLVGNQLKAYALFHISGNDISLQLNETMETRDGNLRLTLRGWKARGPADSTRHARLGRRVAVRVAVES